jgi:polygalacturonase
MTHLIQFAECEDVRVSSLSIDDSPTWTLHVLGCERVRIEDVTINNLCYGSYNDGMDIDGSSRVLVKNCVVTAGDDAFCIKSTGHSDIRRASSDIVFEDCLARTPTNGFKIGTETLDDIRDVVFRRCRVEGPLPFVAPLAGITIASVDGARIENVSVEDVKMGLVRCPVFIRLGARWKNVPPGQRRAGSITGVSLRKVEVASSRQCITLAGLPGQPLRDIQLTDIHVRRLAGTTSARASSDIPELPADYPESPMFGKLPARLLFARHVTGLQMRDMTLETSQAADAAAIIKVDVIENAPAVARP